MGMLLTYREGYFPDDNDPERAEVEHAGEHTEDGNPAAAADAYDDLTDEQVADAYATNVGGQATSRRGQLKALRKLDAEDSDSE